MVKSQNCVKRQGELEPYWVNTSDNQLIKDLLKKSPLTFKRDFAALVEGNTVEKLIDEQMAFQYLNNNPGATWSLLLMAGYLKPAALRKTDQGIFARLAFRIVKCVIYTVKLLNNGYPTVTGIEWYNAFIESLLEGRIEEFKNHLKKFYYKL